MKRKWAKPSRNCLTLENLKEKSFSLSLRFMLPELCSVLCSVYVTGTMYVHTQKQFIYDIPLAPWTSRDQCQKQTNQKRPCNSHRAPTAEVPSGQVKSELTETIN
uniref:Uncharacterized protein n=1 Tax=Timema bartmani TaxID=61472 RepID=A0A7R9F124_9NEOP|nr:unnamed protein product [Timema bartmani]